MKTGKRQRFYFKEETQKENYNKYIQQNGESRQIKKNLPL
jgi:hypothetical protein